MFIYIVCFFATAIFAENAQKQNELIINDGRLSNNSAKKLLWLVLFVWVLLFAFKGATGTDAWSYWSGYKAIYRSSVGFWDFVTARRDFLFQAVEWIVSRASNGSWIFGCVIFSLLIYIPILSIVREESLDIGFSCLWFVGTLNCFMGYNGLRQAIASSFALFAYYKFLRKNRIFGYVLWIFFATGFHRATLLIIPFHIISKFKLKSKTTWLVIVALIVGYTFMWQLWGDMLIFLDDIGQDVLASHFVNEQEASASIGRVLVELSPLVLGLINYKELKEKYNDIDHDIIMIIFSSIFTLYCLKFTGAIRIASYCSVANVVYLPKVLSIYKEKGQNGIRLLILTLYFAYMIFMLLHGESKLYPYMPVWKTRTY